MSTTEDTIFKQKVLGTNCNKNLFYIPSKGNIRSSEELLGNLKKVIAALSYNFIEPDKNVNYSLPIIIPSEKLNEQIQNICDKGKRNAVQQDHVANKKKVDDKINAPVISCAEDLSGKLVEYLCLIDSEEEKRWVKGVVLEKYGKSNYLLRYHEKTDFFHEIYLLITITTN